jgi:serine/threonine protein kinase
MGVVYKALDTHLDCPVAIKILPPDKIADPERKRRFVLEAKAASALRHPNIVVIHDIASDRGRDFIVMEFVDGQSLDRLIGRRGLKFEQALGYAVQIADGLAKAHAAGIIHRDLKPTNVMVAGGGLIKILDFGLAKPAEPGLQTAEAATVSLGQAERPRTEEGFIVGTAAYMSPEQAQGGTVDPRFSFGVLLYEMLTGQKAFQRESQIKTLTAVLNEEPRPASAVNESLPPDVERILARPDEGVVGRDLRKVTQDLMQKFNPSLSRDGRKIAFAAFGGLKTARLAPFKKYVSSRLPHGHGFRRSLFWADRGQERSQGRSAESSSRPAGSGRRRKGGNQRGLATEDRGGRSSLARFGRGRHSAHSFNGRYEFLIGEAKPPAPWKTVPGDDFQGRPYFRRTRPLI